LGKKGFDAGFSIPEGNKSVYICVVQNWDNVLRQDMTSRNIPEKS
jgi:hypothetical protein